MDYMKLPIDVTNHILTYDKHFVLQLFSFTPLKISIRTADETSTKLPVTDLYGAPQRGADSNLHWYKFF